MFVRSFGSIGSLKLETVHFADRREVIRAEELGRCHRGNFVGGGQSIRLTPKAFPDIHDRCLHCLNYFPRKGVAPPACSDEDGRRRAQETIRETG
jgi:hypothetical protein